MTTNRKLVFPPREGDPLPSVRLPRVPQAGDRDAEMRVRRDRFRVSAETLVQLRATKESGDDVQ